MKTKLKVTTALLASLFLVSILAVSTPAIAAKPDCTLMINIMAKGDDADIPPYGSDDGIYRATTLIVGKIKFDEVSGVGLGRVEFHMKIYKIESGEKVYTIKGKLKDGAVMVVPRNYCPVRDVWWTNFWFVMGEGFYKTTGTVIENFEYRGDIITLPNTEGKWSPILIGMMVSPKGEHEEGVWEDGGWAYAGVVIGWVNGNPQFFGGVTSSTKYMEKYIP